MERQRLFRLTCRPLRRERQGLLSAIVGRHLWRTRYRLLLLFQPISNFQFNLSFLIFTYLRYRKKKAIVTIEFCLDLVRLDMVSLYIYMLKMGYTRDT